MATLPLFNDNLPDKQTDDLDSSRFNDYPSIIRDNSGRLILFYGKRFKSGVINGGVVSFITPSFSCHVNAGDGEINGTPVSWLAGDLVLTPDTYTLIYVDIMGNVGQTTDYPIIFMQNTIVLAFVNVGSTTIVRISVMEKNGLYIFNRRQVLSGLDYVWDGYETRLNVGEKPEVFFDSSSNKAYCTYIKDGATFTRMYDTTNELTWEDIPHVQEVSSILYPMPQPANELLVTNTTSVGVHDLSQPPLYQIARDMPVGFVRDSTVVYAHLPYMSSPFISAATPPFQMEVFIKDGTNYTLENTFNIQSAERYTGLETEWVDTTGLKYLGLRINHTLFSGEFVTDPADYSTAWIPDTIDYTVLTDSTHNTTIYPEKHSMEMGASVGVWTKDMELDQIFKFESDDQTSLSMSTSVGVWTKDLESEQIFKFEGDDQTNFSMSTSVGEHTITNV